LEFKLQLASGIVHFRGQTIMPNTLKRELQRRYGEGVSEAEGGTVGDFFALLILFEDVVLLFLGRSDFGWRLGQGFFKNTSGPKGNNNIAGSDNRRRKRMATPIPVAHTQLNTFIASKMTKRTERCPSQPERQQNQVFDEMHHSKLM